MFTLLRRALKLILITNLFKLFYMKNKVDLIGRVGQDPETTDKFARFSLATTENWKDKSGVKQSKTEWHNCVAFSSGLMSIIERFVRKGGTVNVEGKIQSSSFEDKDGVKRKNYSIFVEKIILLSRPEENSTGSYSNDSDYQEESPALEPPKKKAGRPSKEAMGDNSVDDDIPF